MSEFQRLIDTLRLLGIAFEINWQPDPNMGKKRIWQKIMNDAGYRITSASTTLVVVGSMEFLFANGQAHWPNENGLGDGVGPAGCFLLSRNRDTGVVTNRRTHNAADGRQPSTVEGLPALLGAYGLVA